MQESRLFKIVYHLLDKGQATAPELAEKFEVSVRTIYRDIDALSAAGIPIYSETGRNGGIRLMNDFVLDKTVLSKQEKQEILSALQSMNVAQNINNSQTLQKLSAIFNLGSENWLEVDFSRWGGKEFDNEKFELLKSAVIRCKSVRILYANSYGITSERTVHPCKLVYKSKSWYLKAFCTEKQDWRIFKLNRILDLEVLNENFPHKDFPNQLDSSGEECNLITLRFPKEMAYRVYDEFDETQIQHQENGDLIASANMPEDSWLIGYLLSFGAQVDIISPAYLKDVLAEQARLIYEKNKT
ncbi:MAG: YafY family transcriptional regulator [Lachnospiraceae bacterium]|nr:YafY family transcriptional regulator [Lachnospiraceae bacterium]